METIIPKRVRGNEIPCSVPLQIINIADEHPTPQEFVPVASDIIVCRLIGAKIYEFIPEVSENVLTFTAPSTMMTGVYGLEVIVTRAEGSVPQVLRSYMRDVLQIVTSNDEANMATGVEFEVGGEELQGTLLTISSMTIEYTAGTGIVIDDGEISVDTTVVATQTDLAGKANASHTHAQSDVTGLSDALAAKANATHTHSQSDVSGLGDALAGKANATHTHSQSDVTGLSDALAGKASTQQLANLCPIIEDTRTSGVSAITGNAPFTSLVDGQRILLHFATYNAPQNSTLELTFPDGTTTGAIDAKAPTQTGTYSLGQCQIQKGYYVELVYVQSSNRWMALGYDNNTKYSLLTQAQITAGTDTGEKSISAKLLRDNFALLLTSEEVASATDITLACVTNKYYIIGAVTNLTLSFTAPTQGLGQYQGRFTADSSFVLTLPLEVTQDSGSPTSYEAGEVYEFKMIAGYIKIRKL